MLQDRKLLLVVTPAAAPERIPRMRAAGIVLNHLIHLRSTSRRALLALVRGEWVGN
jgi:hypothetical protein